MKGSNERLKGRPATLPRWPGERKDRHRGLLLWAMQHPSRGRSNRAVARAIGVSEGAVRGWRRDQCWDARAAGHEDADQVALDLYRAEYMVDFGVLELPHVAPNVALPLAGATLSDPVVKAAHDAARASVEAAPEALRVAEQASAQAVAKRRRDAREDAEKHLQLVDASLAVLARKLRGDEVKVTVRDIPVLLQCRERLVSIAMGEHGEGPNAVVDSARVAHAKATGGDVIEALWADNEDLRVILGALRARKDADLPALATAQAEAERERERSA
jgi:hypothetical protein